MSTELTSSSMARCTSHALRILLSMICRGICMRCLTSHVSIQFSPSREDGFSHTPSVRMSITLEHYSLIARFSHHHKYLDGSRSASFKSTSLSAGTSESPGCSSCKYPEILPCRFNVPIVLKSSLHPSIRSCEEWIRSHASPERVIFTAL